MSEEAWRPVIPTGREDALVEGFPSYLRESVFRWMRRTLNEKQGYVYSHKFVDFQAAAHIDLGFRADTLHSWQSEVLPHLRKLDTETLTNLIDYLVSQTWWTRGDGHPLEAVLSEGGSAWTVIRWNSNYGRLAKRVSDGVHAAVRGALNASDTASIKLQEAWLDAYGTNPRASVAYSHAVVAVETAALSLIRVNKADATLGDLFSILEADTPKWRLIFREDQKAPGGRSLSLMLRTLWRGHGSRHGRPEYTDASLEEARAAVILAATLVQWFTSGVVVPVGTAPVTPKPTAIAPKNTNG